MPTVRAVHRATISLQPRVLLAVAAVVVALAGTLPISAVRAAEPTRSPQPAASIEASARVEAVIAAATAYVGTPYRVGTEGPDTIDCSGLVFRAFSNAGELGQIGRARLRAAGYMRWFASHNLLTTDPEAVERGDLVMYDNGGHIGIYLGEGRVISALTTGVTVHALGGISVPLTAFLAVDWTGERGPLGPGNVVVPTTLGNPEAPASLVPTVAWTPAAPAEEVAYGPAAEGEERLDMRTANSRTFEDAEGRFTTEIFSRPIHYLPADSTEWQPIDLRFHEPQDGASDAESVVLADTSPVTVTLRDPGADGALLAVTSNQLTVTLNPARAGNAAADPALGEEGRYADYRELFGKETGLRVYPRADGFKSFVVLAKEPETRSFAFTINAPGLTLASELDGSVTLRDAMQAVVGRIPRPMLLDSSDIEGDGGGVRPGAVSLRVDPGTDGASQLTLAIDRASLDEAVYPAYVDLGVVEFPTNAAAAGHTFASSTHANANFSTYQRPESPGYAELWHGRRPDRRDDNEAYLRFAGVAELMSGVNVASASLAVFPYWQTDDATPGATWLARITEEWDARGLTWNTRPMTDAETATFETTRGTWSAMDVTAHIQEVIAGTTTDYGFVLHANEAGRGHWKRLVAESVVGAGALEPRLVVSWTGLRPVASATTQSVGSDALIAWSHAAVAPVPARIQIQLSQDGFESVLSRARLKGDKAGATSLTLATADLAPGAYAWRIRAKYTAEDGWSAWSEPGSIVIVDPTEVRHETDSGDGLSEYVHTKGPGHTAL